MNIDERQVTTSLQRYARGIIVTDDDLDGLETQIGERLHPTRSRERSRRPWDLAVAACAVVALVLAVTALWRSGRTETMPAAPPTTGAVSSVSRADLIGVWTPDHGNNLGYLWLFTADGRWTTTNTASGFRDAHRELVPYDVEAGDILRFGTCRKTVRLGTEGRMTLTALPGETKCDRFPERSMPFIRISPSSPPGSSLERHPYAGPPESARKTATMDDVSGTWLVQGTGIMVVVSPTSPNTGTYIWDDDGDGWSAPDIQGRVVLGRAGHLEFRPTQLGDGDPPPDCAFAFDEVTTTRDTLGMTPSAAGCWVDPGEPEPNRQRWVQLN
ncbi:MULTISPECIES: hypothetical protein [unclassified Knoellia]|uniref:hypothetical protein n=1 Tax=Knoellia altitudinis TaxID=3404795 RepID=UPI00360E08D6